MYWGEKSDGFIENECIFLKVFNKPKRICWKVAPLVCSFIGLLRVVSGQSQKAICGALKVGPQHPVRS